MGWQVRRAGEADAARDAEIDIDGWEAAYRGLIPDAFLDELRYDVYTDRWARILRERTDPGAMFLALDDKGEIRACSLVHTLRDVADGNPSRPTGELLAIYADPGRLGTGAGFAVSQAGMEHLAAQGFRHAVPWVLMPTIAPAAFTTRAAGPATRVTKPVGIGGAGEIRCSRPLQFSRT